MEDSYDVDTTSPFEHDALEESYEVRIESDELEYAEKVSQDAAHGILCTLSRLYSEGEKVMLNERQVDEEVHVEAEYRFENPADGRNIRGAMDVERNGRELPVDLEDAGYSVDVEIDGVRVDQPKMEHI